MMKSNRFYHVDKPDSDFNILKYKMDENLTEEQAQKLKKHWQGKSGIRTAI